MSLDAIQLACLSVGTFAVLLLVWDKSATGGIWFVAVQALAGGLVSFVHSLEAHAYLLTAVVIMGMLVKAVAVPILLWLTARRLSLPSEGGARLHTPAALLVSLLLVLGSMLLLSDVLPGGVASGLALGQALTGVCVVATRRGILAQITGFIATETGISTVLTLAGGLSWSLEFLLLAEAVAAVLVLVGLAVLVRNIAGTGDVALLRQLAEYDEEGAA